MRVLAGVVVLVAGLAAAAGVLAAVVAVSGRRRTVRDAWPWAAVVGATLTVVATVAAAGSI